MDLGGLQPGSQEHAAAPYRVREMNPNHTLLSCSFKVQFNILHLRLGFPSGPFPSGSRTKTLYVRFSQLG
jgi:hypothetical protein